MELETLGGSVPKELHAVPTLGQRHAFGGKAFEFDRTNLRAVLLPLTLALLLFVIVEGAFDSSDRAVKEIDRRPEQIFEIGFEASVCERTDDRIEDVCDRSGNRIGLGQRSWIRLVRDGTVAVELKLGEDMIGRR